MDTRNRCQSFARNGCAGNKQRFLVAGEQWQL
ncbi:MAG: hypothetical protein LBD87_02280 [Prevotellaceae bacterium]|nr:hypothetical protein [Prevotellaceae bacterium]